MLHILLTKILNTRHTFPFTPHSHSGFELVCHKWNPPHLGLCCAVMWKSWRVWTAQHWRYEERLLSAVSAVSQGDVPWDEKDFQYLLVTVAGLTSILLYFYFRDNSREISWKDFVRNYVGRGVVSGTGLMKPTKPVESKPHYKCKHLSVHPGRTVRSHKQTVCKSHSTAGRRHWCGEN